MEEAEVLGEVRSELCSAAGRQGLPDVEVTLAKTCIVLHYVLKSASEIHNHTDM